MGCCGTCSPPTVANSSESGWDRQGFRIVQDEEDFSVPPGDQFAGWRGGFSTDCDCGSREGDASCSCSCGCKVQNEASPSDSRATALVRRADVARHELVFGATEYHGGGNTLPQRLSWEWYPSERKASVAVTLVHLVGVEVVSAANEGAQASSVGSSTSDVGSDAWDSGATDGTTEGDVMGDWTLTTMTSWPTVAVASSNCEWKPDGTPAEAGGPRSQCVGSCKKKSVSRGGELFEAKEQCEVEVLEPPYLPPPIQDMAYYRERRLLEYGLDPDNKELQTAVRILLCACAPDRSRPILPPAIQPDDGGGGGGGFPPGPSGQHPGGRWKPDPAEPSDLEKEIERLRREREMQARITEALRWQQLNAQVRYVNWQKSL